MISTYNFLSVSPAGEVGLPEEHTSLNDGKLSIDRNSQIGHPCPWNEKFPEKKKHPQLIWIQKKGVSRKKKLGKELEQKVVCWFFFRPNSEQCSTLQSAVLPGTSAVSGSVHYSKTLVAKKKKNVKDWRTWSTRKESHVCVSPKIYVCIFSHVCCFWTFNRCDFSKPSKIHQSKVVNWGTRALMDFEVSTCYKSSFWRLFFLDPCCSRILKNARLQSPRTLPISGFAFFQFHARPQAKTCFFSTCRAAA